MGDFEAAAADFEEVDFEEALVVLELADALVEFHLVELDQQELYQDHQVVPIDIHIMGHIEDTTDMAGDIMVMDFIDHGIGDGGIHPCGRVIIIDHGIIPQCMLVVVSLLLSFFP